MCFHGIRDPRELNHCTGGQSVKGIGRADQCKNGHYAAFCDEELRFGIVMEEAMKSKTGYMAKYYRL